MDSDRPADYGLHNRGLKGQWGKWKDVLCAAEGCDMPAKCRGLCHSHYNKKKWADGSRPPSVNKESRRRAHLKHRYGISLERYNAMLQDQGGVCAICKQPPDERTPDHWRGQLCVDHCHDTGAIRGLLCNHCNTAIGNLGSAEAAMAAAEYLKLHSGQSTER